MLFKISCRMDSTCAANISAWRFWREIVAYSKQKTTLRPLCTQHFVYIINIKERLYPHEVKFVCTVYPKKYAHGFCFAVLCCGYTLTDFPISIRLTSLALWQSNDCPSASKATLMNMDKYFMWIHYERLHNHNKAKHNKTVCIFLGIYCIGTGRKGMLIHKVLNESLVWIRAISIIAGSFL